MRHALLIPVAVAVSAVAGCSSAPAPSVERWVEAVAARDGVSVTLALQGTSLASAQRNWASVAVQNLGQRPVRYIQGCGAPASISIEFTEALDPGKKWPGLLGRFKTLALGPEFGSSTIAGFVPESMLTPPGGIPMGCPASLEVVAMEPGQKLSSRAVWDGMLSERPAPAGPATVSAFFPFIGIEGIVGGDVIDATPIEASLTLDVAGSGEGAAMSPALAIDAALADPDFAAWVKAAPENTWINPHLLFTDGVWEVGLFRLGDENPEFRDWFGAVRVDPSGTVVSHRFEPPLP